METQFFLPVLDRFLQHQFETYKTGTFQLERKEENDLLLLCESMPMQISTSRLALNQGIRYIGASEHQQQKEEEDVYTLFAYENDAIKPKATPRIRTVYTVPTPTKLHLPRIPFDEDIQKKPYNKAIQHAYNLLNTK